MSAHPCARSYGRLLTTHMKTIADLFHDRYSVPVMNYEEQAFRRCLYPHVRPVAPILMKVCPRFFAVDHELIGAVGRVSQLDEVEAEIDAFRTHPRQHALLRRMFKIRVSTQRVEKLAKELFLRSTGSALV